MKLSKEEKIEKMDKALKLVQSSTLTKYKIAQDTGISEASIGNYKNGKKRPSFANAEILIRYFEGKMLQNGISSQSKSAIYTGTFTEPIHTFISSSGNSITTNTKGEIKGNSKSNDLLLEIEALKKEIDILKARLDEKDIMIKLLLSK